MSEVSVIVPCYGVEEYLHECVESVLAQGFADYELILVDDGSQDGCPQIIDEYARRDPRVKAIHKQNGGLASARNAGLDVATGTYVYFLDGDDYIEPNLLSTIVPLMREGYDMVAFGLRHDPVPWGWLPTWEYECRVEYNPATEADLVAFISEKFTKSAIRWEAWSRIFRRDTIERFSLRFENEQEVWAEDYCFTMSYLTHGAHVLCIPGVFYTYRQRTGSLMAVKRDDDKIGQWDTLARRVLAHVIESGDCNSFVEGFDGVYTQVVGHQFKTLSHSQLRNKRPLSSIRRLIEERVSDVDYLRRCMFAACEGTLHPKRYFITANRFHRIYFEQFIYAVLLPPSPRRFRKAVFVYVFGVPGLVRMKYNAWSAGRRGRAAQRRAQRQ